MKKKGVLAETILRFFKPLNENLEKHYVKEEISNPKFAELCRVPKTKSCVANEYGVTVKVLNRWLEEKNTRVPRGMICPSDLRKIYAALGVPDNSNPLNEMKPE